MYKKLDKFFQWFFVDFNFLYILILVGYISLMIDCCREVFK